MLASFSLGSIPHEARAETLRSALSSYHLPLEVRLRSSPTLDASFTALPLGRTRVEDFRIRGASGKAVRRSTTADSAVEPALTLHVLNGGELTVQHAGRVAALTSGAMLFSSTHDPLAMAQRQLCAMTTITLPLAQLRVPTRAIQLSLARAFRSTDPVARSCAHLLDRLLRDAKANPDENWTAMERPLTELVRALLLLTTGDERSARDLMGASLSDRIVAYLEQHVLDPDLDPATIASVHGISLRYLYVVLQQQQIPLGDWVREKRLAHAAELLLDPRISTRTISEIAQQAGFTDHAHFSRTFRSRYGVTPRVWRKDHS